MPTPKPRKPPKTAPLPKGKAFIHVKAHKRGFNPPAAKPMTPPNLTGASPEDPEEVPATGGGSDQSDTNDGGVDSEESDLDAGNDGDDSSANGDTDGGSVDECPCGDAGCPGCIVGAMKSPAMKAQFVKQVRAS